jgi:hypothetical protein
MALPIAREFDTYGAKMYRDLEKNAEEWGFLGYSDYTSNDSITKGLNTSVMYFRSVEHLHKFAHGKTHRAGWSWWDEMTKLGKVNEISISHEVYVVPKGGFENIYVNAEMYDFGKRWSRFFAANVNQRTNV